MTQAKSALRRGIVLILLTALFSQNIFAADPLYSEFADPLLKEQLPPATLLAITGLIYIAQLDGKRSREPSPEAVMDSQVALLQRLFQIVQHVYRTRNKALGRKIVSLADAIYLLEPTRGRTGDGYEDIQRLMLAEKLPPAAVAEEVLLEEKNYANPLTQPVFKRWLNKRRSLVNASLADISARGAHSTLVQAILSGLLGGIVSNFSGPSGVGSLARTIQKGASAAKERKKQATSEAKGGAEPSRELEDVIENVAGTVADKMDETLDAITSEEGIITVLKRLSESSDQQIEGFILAFQKSLNTIVTQEVYSITRRIISHFGKENQTKKEALQNILEILFDQYLQQAEPRVIKNIIIDLLKSPVNTKDEDAFRIVVKHFGPIVKNLLQTIGHITDIGPLQMICKSLQDSGAGVAFEKVQEILAQDPNGYKLEFLDDNDMLDHSVALSKLATKGAISGKTIVNMKKRFMKAGKIAQVHAAHLYLKNEDGSEELRPIVVRVLIPNAEKMLEEEKKMLFNLAPDLAKVFVDYRGRVARTERIQELINILHDHLNRETNLEQTVYNQTVAGRRLKGDYHISFRHDRSKGVIHFSVPYAFPAAPKSKIMLMDRVDVAEIDEENESEMEISRRIAGCFYLTTGKELLLRPLCRPQPFKDVQPEDSKGFAHGDPHPGNFLRGHRYQSADGVWHYPVSVTDLGLVVWIPENKLIHIARLQMGAAYNASWMIASALWNLRDDDKAFESEAENKSFLSTYMEVRRVTAYLESQEGASRYWGAGDWIKQFWLYSQLDFPRWLLEGEQVFRALNSTMQSLGLDVKDVEKLNAELRKEFERPVRTAVRKAGWTSSFSVAQKCVRYFIAEKIR